MLTWSALTGARFWICLAQAPLMVALASFEGGAHGQSRYRNTPGRQPHGLRRPVMSRLARRLHHTVTAMARSRRWGDFASFQKIPQRKSPLRSTNLACRAPSRAIIMGAAFSKPSGCLMLHAYVKSITRVFSKSVLPAIASGYYSASSIWMMWPSSIWGVSPRLGETCRGHISPRCSGQRPLPAGCSSPVPRLARISPLPVQMAVYGPVLATGPLSPAVEWAQPFIFPEAGHGSAQPMISGLLH